MIRRIAAISVALTLVSFAAAKADDPGGGSIPIPPPAVAVEEVVIEDPVTAPPPPFVSLESTSIGAGIGFSWGEGVLLFEGQRHAFSVKGLSLVDLGVAVQVSEGAVANLNSLSDFEGHYAAVEAGAAAGVGASVLSMRNQNGVVIHLRSDVSGAQLALGPEGLRITLD
jgi:hypothetical protein